MGTDKIRTGNGTKLRCPDAALEEIMLGHTHVESS